MIAYLNGVLTESELLRAVVECAGVGYEVQIPITTAEKLPAVGSSVKLSVVAIYREDSQALYGFATAAEKNFFKLLIEKVSGVGPKVALGVLSHMSVPVLQQAIARGDVALLSKCPGIGKKTAERIVIELKDKLSGSGVSSHAAVVNPPIASAEGDAFQDAVSALVALGHKLPDADKAIRRSLQKLGHQATTEELIKESFR